MQIQTLSDVWNRSAQRERGDKGLKKITSFNAMDRNKITGELKKSGDREKGKRKKGTS